MGKVTLRANDQQNQTYRRILSALLPFLAVIAFAFPQPAKAYTCTGCVPGDTQGAARIVQTNHKLGEEAIKKWIDFEFELHREWLVEDFFKGAVLPAMKDMTRQMSMVAMHHAMIIGTFFDAQQQLQSERLLQELQYQAHKDFQPSDSFCTFGTNTRVLAASEQLSEFTTSVMASRQMKRHLGNANSSGAGGQDADKLNRWNQFKAKYCDPMDNNGVLEGLCANDVDESRKNIDIDYTRLIEVPRTLDINFTDGGAPTPAEEDVMALGNNLFGNSVLSRSMKSGELDNEYNQQLYFALRSVAAKRSVAEHSYNAIVGLKANGSNVGGTRAFLGAIVRELGVPEGEVFDVIGQDPSYYAQLEILAKKLYQSPEFFAGLYDKPANVARKSVALSAIDLMLDRAIYESQLRQEMAMSVLLSAKMKPEFDRINGILSGGGQ